MPGALPSFALERFFARYEFQARYLLCTSDCESMSVGDLLAMEPGAEAGFHRHWLGYTESAGSPSLRGEISRLYEEQGPHNILVHSGAEEAIYLFMRTLSPSDHIIVQQPCYQSLHAVAGSIGCDVSAWKAREEDGWRLDPSDLKALIRPATRAIVINSPNNPTGSLASRADFEAILQLAEDRGIILFSDEVYRGLEYDEADRLPSACDLGEHAVSLGVMSKAYGLAGLRIGWLATRNTTLLARVAALKDYTTICSSAPSEFLAELALRHGDAIVRRNRDIIAANLRLLDGFFERRAEHFVWSRPSAGPIGFPRLRGGDSERFCDELVRDTGVLLLPGAVYGDRDNHFRIGFGRRNMPEALARLEESLDRQGRAGRGGTAAVP
jgi:aspartate/methionine/tyrosine aminotransferase